MQTNIKKLPAVTVVATTILLCGVMAVWLPMFVHAQSTQVGDTGDVSSSGGSFSNDNTGNVNSIHDSPEEAQAAADASADILDNNTTAVFGVMNSETGEIVGYIGVSYDVETTPDSSWYDYGGGDDDRNPTASVGVTDCYMEAGESSCETEVTWWYSNCSDGPSLINGATGENINYWSGGPNGDIIYTGPTMTEQTQNVTISEGATYFTFYCGTDVIRSVPAIGHCVEGTAWNGAMCVAIPADDGTTTTTGTGTPSGNDTGSPTGGGGTPTPGPSGAMSDPVVSISLEAGSPFLVRRGGTVNLVWSVNASAPMDCIVTGEIEGDQSFPSGNSPDDTETGGTLTTAPITNLTNFTLSCTDEDNFSGETFTDQVTISVVPSIMEI